jgi:hypothetical protein
VRECWTRFHASHGFAKSCSALTDCTTNCPTSPAAYQLAQLCVPVSTIAPLQHNLQNARTQEQCACRSRRGESRAQVCIQGSQRRHLKRRGMRIHHVVRPTSSNKFQDLNLPKSIVQRLAKGVLPPNTQIQKDALLAMSKSATVFVNYITSWYTHTPYAASFSFPARTNTLSPAPQNTHNARARRR